MKAKEKLTQYGLPALTDAELLEILKYKGTQETYYQSPEFKAAKELLRRYERPEEAKIKRSQDAANIMSFLETESNEQFWCIFLKRSNAVICTEFISKGDATGCVVNIQQITRRALELKAQAVVLSHNHPSGNQRPSDADLHMTKKVKEGLRLFDIALVDHVIIAANNGHFSFAEEGMI